MAAAEKTTPETAQKLGLLPEEFDRIEQILGRNPNFTELSIYSVMWSEHCSYKNSISQLKTLPRSGDRLLVGAGEENAGLVDIGDGLGCCFKIESHNHPSAIEPYQGAATGVGGIHRDIFTMGARPIAALNSLRFGPLESSHMKNLVRGVVKGIGDYGNCFGVPTVGGEVYFQDCYSHDILVNAMSAGIVRAGETVSATSGDVAGNPVFIVGSRTGKDGIHGATFASADLTEDSAKDLPAVQVGDPFQEKLLLEATLEAIKTGSIVGMQDMGAAGITCSTSEMSAKGGMGMKIDLDRVPTRQAGMKDWEILLSESQERMLIVAHRGREKALFDIFEKWDLECAEIGEVVAGGQIQFFQHGKMVADVPAETLVLGGGAPVYQRKTKRPSYLKKIEKFSLEKVKQPKSLLAEAKKLWKSPNLVSKSWISRQYDSTVRTGTMTTNRASDAAIVYVKGTKKALALTVDCNSSYVYADPFRGAMIAVAEAARNIVCAGGEPVAITNCLNFGNPYNPEVYFQFAEAIRGMGAACRRFGTPVTGGNVSFYNQTKIAGKEPIPVFPTPTIGMLGILDDRDRVFTLDFKAAGDAIFLIGKSRDDLGSSEFLRFSKKVKHSPCPHFDLEEEVLLQKSVAEIGPFCQSVHDISEGGLFQNLMESAMASKNLGFEIALEKGLRGDCFLFGESQSRVVVSVKKEQVETVERMLKKAGQPFSKIGQVVDNQRVTIENESWGKVSAWKKIHDTELEQIMEN